MSIGTGGMAGLFFEGGGEVVDVGEADVCAHFTHPQVLLPKQFFGFGDSQLSHIGHRRHAGVLLEEPGEVKSAEVCETCQIVELHGRG